SAHIAKKPHTPYTLSLHDALPISKINAQVQIKRDSIWNLDIEPRIERMEHRMKHFGIIGVSYDNDVMDKATGGMIPGELITVIRSEEHTSELQSRENLVCRLLLEK